jgi:hypothetical protein
MSEKQFIPIGNILPPMPCYWSVGPYLERFYQDLSEKKFTGVRCPKCGRVYVPPRRLCASCRVVMSDFVEVKGTGSLLNFTVAHQSVNGARRERPVIFGLVKLEGADTGVLGEIRGIAPEAVRIGLKLQAVFAEKPGVTVESLSHFAPAGQGA